MRFRTLTAAALMLVAGTAVAGGLDANLNDDSARLGLSWDAGGSGPGALNGEAVAYYNTDEVYVGGLGIYVVGETGNNKNPLEAGVGGKVIGIHVNHDQGNDFNGFGLAPGFGVRYYPAAINRLDFALTAYYAPDVVSFGDATNIFEGTFRVEYQVIPQAFAYVGYRYLGVEFDETDKREDLDQGVHAGFRILFQ